MSTKEFNRTAKYLKGNISLKEKKEHQEWVDEKEENRKKFELLKKLWDHSDFAYQIDDVQTEAQWKELEARLSSEDRASKARFLNPSWVYYAAASVAILLLAGWWFYGGNQAEIVQKERGFPKEELIIERLITTQLAAISEVKSFYLPDSSIVWLDDQSTISYDNQFNISNRVVELKGRAFFDIKKDTSKSFVINAKNTNIEVLGTSFNVSALPGDNVVEVTVLTGLVTFSVDAGGSQPSVLLKPNEKGIFYLKESILDKRDNDDPDFMNWMRKEPKEVTKKLDKKRVHKVTHETADDTIELKKILDHRFQWKKNLIHQTVVEGEITNFSDSITYKEFLLKITCYNEKQKKEYSQEYMIDGPIAPGETVKYKKAFMIDWLSSTSDVKITVESVK